MMFRTLSPVRVVLILALLLMLGACSEEESPTQPTETATQVTPLTENYYPLPASGTWEYVRLEGGVLGIFEDYYNANIPAAHTTVSIETPDGGSADDRLFRGRTIEANKDTLQYAVEFSMRKVANGFDLVDQNSEASFDSSFVFTAAGVPYAWYRFGVTRWEGFQVSYAGESMNQDYFGEEQGKVVLSNAIGFDYPRIIYDGGEQPEGKYDISDVDYDTYVDGIIDVTYVGEVIDEMDVVYADLRLPELVIPPELLDTVYLNCKVVRFSIEATSFMTNQRNPNTSPGQTAINDPYLPGVATTVPARRDLGLVFLAPDVGPVIYISYVDMDKTIMVGDPTVELALFQGDLLQYDFLLSYTPE